MLGTINSFTRDIKGHIYLFEDGHLCYVKGVLQPASEVLCFWPISNRMDLLSAIYRLTKEDMWVKVRKPLLKQLCAHVKPTKQELDKLFDATFFGRVQFEYLRQVMYGRAYLKGWYGISPRAIRNPKVPFLRK